jgi:hypothetical protein
MRRTAAVPLPHLQCDLDHVWLCCDDLVLGWQLRVALVLEVSNGSAEVEVAIHTAHTTNFTQEPTCSRDKEHRTWQGYRTQDTQHAWIGTRSMHGLALLVIRVLGVGIFTHHVVIVIGRTVIKC